MTMNSNVYFLDVWEELKIAFFFFFFFEAPFEKNSVFNENLPPEDDVRDKIWCQILLTLLTQDLENLIGKPDANFQVAISAHFYIFSALFELSRTPC